VLGKRPAPIPFYEMIYSTLTTFRILDSLRERCEVPVGWSLSSTVDEAAASKEGQEQVTENCT